MARPHALVAVAGLLLAQAARADVIKLPATRATLELDVATWTAVTPDVQHGLVLGYTQPNATLVIARAPVPNPAAWRAKTRDAYVDQIERGLAASIIGYQRTARTIGEVGGVPMFDLEARGAGTTAFAIRVLMFRTYALTLVVEVPRAALAPARAITRSFGVPSP